MTPPFYFLCGNCAKFASFEFEIGSPHLGSSCGERERAGSENAGSPFLFSAAYIALVGIQSV